MFKAGDIVRSKNPELRKMYQLVELVAPRRWKFKHIANGRVADFLYPFDEDLWEVVKPTKKKRYL